MNSELELKLSQSTARRIDRESLRNYVIRKEIIEELTAIAFSLQHESHVMAFWTLELVCEKKLKFFVPFIDSFCEVLPKLKDDSSIRPATKIAYFLAKSNHRKNGITLSHEQEHNLIEALVDRLIQEEKVAAKVYAMKALFVFGKKYNWINDELKQILVQDFPNQTPAYRSATKHILKKLNN